MHDTVRAGLTIVTVVPLEGATAARWPRSTAWLKRNATTTKMREEKCTPREKSARKCCAYEKRVRPALRWYALPPNGYSGPGYSSIARFFNNS